MKNTAVVFNIQRYSIHDGPGIRTVVFLKGCPLNCLWCSNPESQNKKPQVIYTSNTCIGCGACLKVCKYEAVALKNDKIQFYMDRCTSCGECLEVCCTNSMEIVGKTMTVDEVIYEIEKDKQFYSNSEGGVTFSGGEPILHSEFLHSIVPKLKEKGIHVAIETTGYGEWEEFFKVVKDMDLILFDLKEMNSEKHDKYTGVHNQLIIENAKKISKIKETIFRLPVIPGYNDEIENFKQVVTLLKELDHECSVHLLPYHTYGKEKYKKLGKKYNLPEVESPSKEDMQKIANIFEKSDIKASIV